MATSPAQPGARIEVLPPGPRIPAAGAPQPLARHGYRGRLFRKYLLLILTLVTGALLASGGDQRLLLVPGEQGGARQPAAREGDRRRGRASSSTSARSSSSSKYAALPQLDAGDVELRRIEFLKLLRQAPEVTDIAQIDRRRAAS